MCQVIPTLSDHSLFFRFKRKTTTEGHHQMNGIFDGVLCQVQFQKAAFVFDGIYPEHRPLQKSVILNCRRLYVRINNCEIDSTYPTKKIFEDLLEWLHAGGVVVDRTKQLRLEYYSTNHGPLLAFLDGLKQVFLLFY